MSIALEISTQKAGQVGHILIGVLLVAANNGLVGSINSVAVGNRASSTIAKVIAEISIVAIARSGITVVLQTEILLVSKSGALGTIVELVVVLYTSGTRTVVQAVALVAAARSRREVVVLAVVQATTGTTMETSSFYSNGEDRKSKDGVFEEHIKGK